VTVLGVAAAWFEPYRAPASSASSTRGATAGRGYQTVQAMIGLGSGGIFGTGLGTASRRSSTSRSAHGHDFAVIARSSVSSARWAVIAAYVAFAYAGLRIALAARDPFGKTLAAGIVTLVCAQAAVNLAAVLGSLRSPGSRFRSSSTAARVSSSRS
jgi:cell division protein FtsW